MDANKNEEVVEKLIEALGHLSDAVQPLTEAERENLEQAEKSKKTVQRVNKEFENFGRAIGSFVSAMASADDGTGKYATAVTGASNAVANIAGEFGFLGKGLGVLINIFGSIAGNALKQNDALLKAYRGLAEVGDLGYSGLSNLRETIHQVGLSVDGQSEIFVNIIKQQSDGLAAFGGSVTAGTQRFTKMFSESGALGEFQFVLERFGYTTASALKSTAFWATQLAMTGAQNKLTQEQLGRSTQNYLINLAALADLTGESRDAMEAKMKKEENDLRFQFYLSKLENSKNAEDVQRAQNLRLQIAAMPESAASGLKSLIVNAGAIVDKSASQFYMVYGPDGVQRALNTSKASAEEFPKMMHRLRSEMGEKFVAGLNRFNTTLNASNETMGELGYSADVYKWIMAGKNESEEEFNKRLAKLRDNQIAHGMDENTARLQTERQFRNAYENLEGLIAQKLIPTMMKFQQVVLEIAKKFYQLLGWMGGSDLDLSDSFVDMSNLGEIAKALADNDKTQLKLKKELAGAEHIELLRKNKLNEIEKRLEDTKLKEEERLKLEEHQAKLQVGVKNASANVSSARGRLEQKQQFREQLLNAQSTITNKGNLTDFNAMGAKAPTLSGKLTTNGKAGTGPITPMLQQKIDMLAQVLPDAIITSMNDAATFKDHSADKSKHGRGQALDLVLPEMNKLTPEQRAEVVAKLSGLGLRAWFEKAGQKNANGSVSSADHFHAELGARTGGIFSGPQSGYTVQLHGREAVVPMSKFSNFFKGMGTGNSKNVDKRELGSAKSEFNFSGNSDLSRLFSEMMGMMASKFDDMIYQQRQTTNAQEQMIRFAKH